MHLLNRSSTGTNLEALRAADDGNAFHNRPLVERAARLEDNGPVSSPIIAGYVLVRPAASPPGMESVPSEIITISDCIQDDLPRPKFWDWFQDLADALSAQELAPRTRVVAVALEPDDADQLIEEMGGPDQPWFALLGRRVPATGELLGYELIGAEHALDFHSWHCHGYADDLLAAGGIVVNELGLLPTLAEAQVGLMWMTDLPADEAPAPVPWCVAALFAIPPVIAN